MLSHGNIIADASAAIKVGMRLQASDVHLSYLPLAHMFERIVQVSSAALPLPPPRAMFVSPSELRAVGIVCPCV
jgi:long-subunit acyl-CoA synthetase (AMP-forming)